jgi:hypothetical protein
MRVLKIIFFLMSSFAIKAQEHFSNAGSLYLHPTANVSFKGNITNNGAFISDTGHVYLIGNTSQTISGAVAIELHHLTTTNSNTAGIILNNNIGIAGELFFNDGMIFTNSSSMILFKDNSTFSGVSDMSYIDGPCKKIGNDSFSFPVGKNGNYQSLSVSSPSNVTDTLTAEYFQANPSATVGFNIDAVIDHISACEYWRLDRNSGNSLLDISLSWDAASCGVTLLSDLRIAHWDTTQWVSMGNMLTTGDFSQGAITSNPLVGSFGFFTLASISPENPLPIELLSFDVIKGDDEAFISWETASERENLFFTIEKSHDGNTFEVLEIVSGLGSSSTGKKYFLEDNQPYNNLSYYRLKQTDINGDFKYAEIKSVFFGVGDELDVYPNPSNGEFINVSLPSRIEKAEIKVQDNSGKIMQTFTIDNTKLNSNLIHLNFENKLSKGIYYLSIENDSYNCMKKIIVN